MDGELGELASQLRHHREQRGLTQEELAEATRAGAENRARSEHGRRDSSSAMLISLMKCSTKNPGSKLRLRMRGVSIG